MHLSPAPRRALAVLTLLSAAPLAAQQAHASSESLYYGVEWRFVRAGDVQANWNAGHALDLKLRTVGLVATLFKVEDSYRSTYDPGFCATSISLDLHEGRRNRDVKAAFDRAAGRSTFIEKDLNTGATTLSKEMEVPSCVHDVAGGLRKLRQLRPEPGTVTELPLSDGKKVVMARIEAQQRETVRTPLGQYSAIRYEAFLFNGVFYGRKGRLFVWISDDDKRLPVQIRIQLPFYVGTITLQLEKAQ
ncbi:MAG: DUF3108 domain-containing protein [Candidatus Solibacter usitatus]|nr:DUF3108 domain-containing protein [Candidatus Solibacter usitatus]